MKLAYTLLAGMALLLAACTNSTKSTDLINHAASFPASFSLSKQGWKVITSSINKKKGTMSTLYGNVAALKNLKTDVGEPDANEALALVTWQQQADDHWFGAKIPANLLSVEVVKTSADKSISYQKLDGKDLVPDKDTTDDNERIRYILSSKPSVMP